MFRRLKKVLGAVFLTQILMWLAGRIIQRQLLSEDLGLNAVNAAAIVSGKEQTFVARGFTGGKVRVMMGGLDLDISQCQISPPPAIIEANILCGGVQIKVPNEWKVSVETSVIMGGVEDTRTYANTSEQAPVDLIITGRVMFGGLSIN